LFKKFIIIAVVVAILTFFTLPAFVFANDAYTPSTVGEQDGIAGQYVLTETGTGQVNDVVCIDGDHVWDSDTGAYSLSTNSAYDALSDEFAADSNISTTDADAVAVQILTTTASGATAVEDQAAIWKQTQDRTYNPDTPQEVANIAAITASVDALAAQYVTETPVEADRSAASIETFLDKENINEVVVELDGQTLVTDDGSGNVSYNVFEATATMENPLVPTITDNNKSTNWYLLEGSFNTSFSSNSLVTETSSTMSDVKDDSDGENTTDNDGDSDITGDHYGLATVKYYYFWWGGTYIQNTMNANIFAWVDIDGDSDLDAKGIDTSIDDPETTVNEKDGIPDTLADATLAGLEKVALVTAGVATLSPVFDSTNTDLYKIDGGKVFVAESAADQRLVSQSYDEPYDSAEKEYTAGTITVNKTDINTGLPIAGAVFNIIDADGKIVATMASGADGVASYTGLPWGEYTVVETGTLGGYYPNNTEYPASISGPGGYPLEANASLLDQAEIIYNSEDILSITNTPIPPYVPPTPTTTLTVAALTEETVEVEGIREEVTIKVAGIQELPFTGTSIAFTIAGAAALALSLLLIVYLSSRKNGNYEVNK